MSESSNAFFPEVRSAVRDLLETQRLRMRTVGPGPSSGGNGVWIFKSSLVIPAGRSVQAGLRAGTYRAARLNGSLICGLLSKAIRQG